MLKKFFNGIINFVLPPVCVSCEKPPEDPSIFLCSACRNKLILFNDSHPWMNEFINNGIIDGSFSLYRFIKDTPIQHLLHSLKYEKMRSIGIMLGKEIGKAVKSGINFDYTVPVPLHSARSRERTYNQSEYICRGIKEITGADVLPDLLMRIRYTDSQTKLNKLERRENVRGAFAMNNKLKHLAADKNIIVADDVITTGSTILECARLLKENGAAKVFVCSAAYDLLD